VPEIPAVPGLTERTTAVFAPDGGLARTVADYEPRSSQLEMAAAVARIIERGGVLFAEAGTGTGKTLAYLVPAILSRQRVLISTGTKNLQEQIFFKDIPALRAALDVPFTAAYMKGRANYLCLHRLDQMVEGGGLAASGANGARQLDVQSVFLPMIREWSARTESGDRAELEDLPEDLPFWNEVSATAETCLGTECPRYNDCFVTKMRQRAAESDVVIVNHHLLCADAAVRQNAYGEVIPACPNAVVDEAHQLEDIATQYFGYAVSNYRIDDFARDVEKFAAACTARSPERGRQQDGIGKAIRRLRDDSERFFAELVFTLRGNHAAARHGRLEERVRVTGRALATVGEAAAYLTGALDLVEGALALLREPKLNAGETAASDQDEDGASEQLAALVRRAGEIRDELRRLLRADDPDFVYFVEFRGKGTFLRASPIEVAAIIRQLLVEKMRSVVFTSATLTVDDSFDYIRRRLGVGTSQQLRLRSEFDFAKQAVMYLPPRMPDPRSADFALAAGRQVVEILKRTRGRAFVLFTSYASLRAVQSVAEMSLNYPLLVQGTAPRSQLLKEFRTLPHAVLFATSSFWQGVDVAGEALSCVIVDKLPFASPGDPITSARIDAIRARGGEPFDEYQVPLAILTLQQGLGRLIRHRRDRGVLAVLDPRLQTKGYGRRFIASLPPAPVVRELEAVEGFFSIV
jgi:ATP-dependent DNA helicase DinG